jgi:hypothetical protein
LLFLAKQQAAGNTNAVTQAAIKVAAHISNGDEDLGHSLAQDMDNHRRFNMENLLNLLLHYHLYHHHQTCHP